MSRCFSCYVLDSKTDETIAEFCCDDYNRAQSKGENYIKENKLDAYIFIMDTTDKYID